MQDISSSRLSHSLNLCYTFFYAFYKDLWDNYHTNMFYNSHWLGRCQMLKWSDYIQTLYSQMYWFVLFIKSIKFRVSMVISILVSWEWWVYILTSCLKFFSLLKVTVLCIVLPLLHLSVALMQGHQTRKMFLYYAYLLFCECVQACVYLPV